MLTIDNLTCGYGAVIAAAEVSFTVGKGEILAILGSNGAGKHRPSWPPWAMCG
ncbi:MULTISPECIES: hypothetical protein [unclassified Rhizobium]|uniref:hypothetical protein n=1 Tax=unclassified Rhizobium TaxID=2613769 RepID=UPI000BC8C21C|nr:MULTISPECIES: hypothetical protein [unclassified Rhizobium]SOD50641.1 ABC transporter [Rhizobium sp. AN6A]